jgi:hypothetical protein
MSDPAYLRNLKSYARAQYGTAEESAEIVIDFQNESDRGAIILAATSIEDMLENALGLRMKTLETDNEARAAVFGAEGTISTYSQKTLIAYALGIIDKKARKEIDLVRNIRNACAHSRKPLSLEIPVLVNAIHVAIGEKTLKIMKDHSPRSLKAAFICHCAALAYYVGTGQRKEPLEIFAEAAKVFG